MKLKEGQDEAIHGLRLDRADGTPELPWSLFCQKGYYQIEEGKLKKETVRGAVFH